MTHGIDVSGGSGRPRDKPIDGVYGGCVAAHEFLDGGQDFTMSLERTEPFEGRRHHLEFEVAALAPADIDLGTVDGVGDRFVELFLNRSFALHVRLV